MNIPPEADRMVSTGEIKRGMTIELDGNLYQIVEFQHIKMGRGSAQVRMKLRNVRRGDLIEKTFQAGDRFARARLDHRDVQYMYHDGDLYHFMDTKTYDQVALNGDQLGDGVNYLTDGMVVTLNEYESEPIGVDLPPSVVLTVKSVEFGLKGDTATGANKPATLESGLKVNVPLFVNQGDKIRVDTRTGEYIERAS
ncbi:MAG TPA: elongation factor P [Candidatus Saccharimonadales bacterium]|nr:elongation factor P [Candidatus Saccharimonadales bacterium]